LDSSFFGLTSDTAPLYRKNLFKQIHEIVFHGNGGYSWSEIYNMPRWLRLFTFKEIEDHFKKQKEEYEKVSSGGSSTMVGTDGKINPQNFSIPNKSSYK
jgi:hypothetical protein